MLTFECISLHSNSKVEREKGATIICRDSIKISLCLHWTDQRGERVKQRDRQREPCSELLHSRIVGQMLVFVVNIKPLVGVVTLRFSIFIPLSRLAFR